MYGCGEYHNLSIKGLERISSVLHARAKSTPPQCRVSRTERKSTYPANLHTSVQELLILQAVQLPELGRISRGFLLALMRIQGFLCLGLPGLGCTTSY